MQYHGNRDRRTVPDDGARKRTARRMMVMRLQVEIRRRAAAENVLEPFDRFIGMSEDAGLFVRPYTLSVMITPPTHHGQQWRTHSIAAGGTWDAEASATLSSTNVADPIFRNTFARVAGLARRRPPRSSTSSAGGGSTVSNR